MRFPVEFLVVSCLVVGIIPGLSIGPFLNSAVRAVLGDQTPNYSLAVWHGINTPLLMSMFALVGGIVFYLFLRRYFNLIHCDRVPVFYRFNGKQIYENNMLRLASTAARLEKWLGTVRLQPQILLLMIGFLVAPLLAVAARGAVPSLASVEADPLFALLWIIGGACAIATAWQAKYHRLAALCLVSGTGIVTCATFLWLSAPDLALTQLMVETVTTVLILLGLRWLPPRIAPEFLNIVTAGRTKLRRTRDFSLALAAGTAMAALSYISLVKPGGGGIGEFFLEHALPEGGGSNVVNVLLVDFRGFDTLGEISVLSIVALTVYALLRRFRPAPESIAIPAQQTNSVDPATRQAPVQQATSGYLLIPGVYLRLLLPIIIVVAVYFFMRGHNQPGGGFVAGLIFAVAIILQYMLAGTTWVESNLRFQPHRWLGFGLLVATVTGLGAWLLGYPFLTSHTAHLTLPVLGDMHLPSAFMFDLGVFAVVVGSTMLILVALAHQSIRSHRQASVVNTEEPAAPEFNEETD
jgi:multicomponent K+:H+ antiporter subunit A